MKNYLNKCANHNMIYQIDKNKICKHYGQEALHSPDAQHRFRLVSYVHVPWVAAESSVVLPPDPSAFIWHLPHVPTVTTALLAVLPQNGAVAVAPVAVVQVSVAEPLPVH